MVERMALSTAHSIAEKKTILYGCGDFLNDYEGIQGHEDFRDNLGLMYLLSVESSSGELVHLHMIPPQIKHFRINRASHEDSIWLRDRLDRECIKLGTRLELSDDDDLNLIWSEWQAIQSFLQNGQDAVTVVPLPSTDCMSKPPPEIPARSLMLVRPKPFTVPLQE